MKKIIIFVMTIILVSGCGMSKEKYEKILEGYAKTYYERHMDGVDNQQQAEITLQMLKKANEVGDGYDLSKLKKCKDSTTVIINLDENKNIVGYEYKLKCD